MLAWGGKCRFKSPKHEEAAICVVNPQIPNVFRIAEAAKQRGNSRVS